MVIIVAQTEKLSLAPQKEKQLQFCSGCFGVANTF
jgi:hypothetical protein